MSMYGLERPGWGSAEGVERLAPGPSLYVRYELARAALRLVTAGVQATNMSVRTALEVSRGLGVVPPFAEETARRMRALAEMSERVSREYPKPEYGLDTTVINGEQVPVKEVVREERAFGNLLHFDRETDRDDPKVLIVAPMSGHYSTLLRDTVRQMLPSHDVYLTDWKNARDVPLSEGNFGLEDYVDYMAGFIQKLGPDTNVVAVCQATVPTLAAIAHLAEKDPDSQPLSMTLMAGPLDTAAAATSVTDFANRTKLEMIERSWITRVPDRYAGAGRLVYPGFVQLTNFMAMNPDKHRDAHIKLYRHLVERDIDPANIEAARKIQEFYDEYFAVADLAAPFYLDTVRSVFQERALANGTMTHRGEAIRPAAINRTAVLTIEGGEDDISAPGQTSAVHGWLTGIDPSLRSHHLQEGAGHYGVFNGRAWSTEIAPRIAGMIRDVGARRGLSYDEPASVVITPERWSGEAA